jgi:dephospho-CoA kinase
MSFRVGLTGGIGCGKSTVADLFAELGTPVIDTDLISHQLTQTGGAAIPQLRSEFGAEFIDASGALDRARMRQRVFSDPQARVRLESILHPLILAQAQSLAASATSPYVILVIPLLFESAAYQCWLNRTLAVDCPEEAQISRASRRSGLDEAMIRAIMSQQISRAQRLLLADDIIQNNADVLALRPQVERLHRLYLDLSERSN